ncbi:MAG: AraC family transcriptional regulator [Ekhidna sp.]|nr:AraC family transcriptional regulator [Ekhidna sp.]
MVAGGLIIAGVLGIWYIFRFKHRKDDGVVPEDDSELASLFDKANALLEREKYFLNKNLKLTDLATELSCGERDLSRAINKFSKSNFNKFINSFRIRYSKEILSNSKFDHYTIEAIAEDSGFSNKVSFYNAFKSEIGMSPTQFRALEQSH